MHLDSWKGIPLEHRALWRKIFDSHQTEHALNVLCPICGQFGLRQYYMVEHYNGKVIKGEVYLGEGSLWEWCNKCHHYEHMSVFVPNGWDFCLELDKSKLTHTPSYIEGAFNDYFEK